MKKKKFAKTHTSQNMIKCCPPTCVGFVSLSSSARLYSRRSCPITWNLAREEGGGGSPPSTGLLHHLPSSGGWTQGHGPVVPATLWPSLPVNTQDTMGVGAGVTGTAPLFSPPPPPLPLLTPGQSQGLAVLQHPHRQPEQEQTPRSRQVTLLASCPYV